MEDNPQWQELIAPASRMWGSLDFSIGLELVKNVCLSVTSISSYSFEARKLKIGTNNPDINGTKSTDQFFWHFVWGQIYLRSNMEVENNMIALVGSGLPAW